MPCTRDTFPSSSIRPGSDPPAPVVRLANRKIPGLATFLQPFRLNFLCCGARTAGRKRDRWPAFNEEERQREGGRRDTGTSAAKCTGRVARRTRTRIRPGQTVNKTLIHVKDNETSPGSFPLRDRRRRERIEIVDIVNIVATVEVSKGVARCHLARVVNSVSMVMFDFAPNGIRFESGSARVVEFYRSCHNETKMRRDIREVISSLLSTYPRVSRWDAVQVGSKGVSSIITED